jgi:hypothetical protein
MAEELWQRLQQQWGATNPYATTIASNTPLTAYQKAEVARWKQDQADREKQSAERLQEQMWQHRENDAIRRNAQQIQLVQAAATWNEHRNKMYYEAWQQYLANKKAERAEYDKMTSAEASAYVKEGKATQALANNYSKVLAQLETIGSAPSFQRELAKKVIERKLDPTNHDISQQYYRGISDPRQVKRLYDFAVEYFQLPLAQRAEKLKEWRDMYATEGSESSVRDFFEQRARHAPSPNPQEANEYARNMITGYGENPYREMLKASYQPAQQTSATTASATQPPLRIGGYSVGSHGAQLVPASGASAADVSLINKFNQSDEAKKITSDQNLTNEAMAERVQKFINKGTNNAG